MIYALEDTYDKNKDASVDERFLIWAVALFDYYVYGKGNDFERK